MVLLDKLPERGERDWYATAAVEYGWSRNVLLHQIMNRLHQRAGAAQSNFPAQLPARDSSWPSSSPATPTSWTSSTSPDRPPNGTWKPRSSTGYRLSCSSCRVWGRHCSG